MGGSMAFRFFARENRVGRSSYAFLFCMIGFTWAQQRIGSYQFKPPYVPPHYRTYLSTPREIIVSISDIEGEHYSAGSKVKFALILIAGTILVCTIMCALLCLLISRNSRRGYHPSEFSILPLRNQLQLDALGFPSHQIPSNMICPITQAMMVYPVRTTAGMVHPHLPSYEASAIRYWLNGQSGAAIFDPVGNRLSSKKLFADTVLQGQIRAFIADKKRAAVNLRFFYTYEPDQCEDYQPLADLVPIHQPVRMVKL